MPDEIPPPPPAYGSPPPPPPGYRAGDASPPYAPGPEGPSDPNGPYAGFWPRVGANLLDGLILSVIALVCMIPVFIVLGTGETEIVPCTVDDDGFRIDGFDLAPNATCEELTDGTVLAAVGVGLVCAIPFVLVMVWFYRRLGRTGMTWGRSAANIRLVDATSGLPIGGWRAFGRYILSSVFSYALFLGYFWMLWDKRKQTWHDKVVSSVVVRDPR